MTQTERAEVMVVGAGLMGAAAARHLARAGRSVALVGPDEPADKRSHHGVFASHYDEGRVTRALDEDADWSLLSQRAIARYPEIAAEGGAPFFTEAGGMMLGPEAGPGETMARNVSAVAARFSIDADRLDAEGLAARFPFFAAPEGAVGFHERAGAGHVSPRALARAQSAAAERRGARRLRREALALEETAQGVVAHLSGGGRVTAERAIVAAGAFANLRPLTPEPLPMTAYARTILFWELDADQARALAGMPSMVIEAPDFGARPYLLPPIRYPDGRIYLKIGGERDDLTIESFEDAVAWFQSDGRAAAAEALDAFLRERLPGVSPRATSSGSCAVTFTRSGKPIISRLSDRVTALAGGCGAGAKCSDELGRLGALVAFGGDVRTEGYAADFAP